MRTAIGMMLAMVILLTGCGGSSSKNSTKSSTKSSLSSSVLASSSLAADSSSSNLSSDISSSTVSSILLSSATSSITSSSTQNSSSSELMSSSSGASLSSGSASSVAQSVINTGVFLDSPVINIGYRTETQEGVTNELGEYKFIEGETVTFFIGELELPASLAKEVVTPFDLVGVTDINNSTVVNIIRLLQTLDRDGIPENGITITDTAKSIATPLNFGLSESEFETSPTVTNLISNAAQHYAISALIPKASAIESFESSLNETFSINMSGRTATSEIINSSCVHVPGGFEYSFSDSVITIIGSDGWFSSGEGGECRLTDINTLEVTPEEVVNIYHGDFAFNCSNYPICTMNDFERNISGVDVDGRTFTLSSSFDRATLKVTLIKNVAGSTFTEQVYIEDKNNPVINMSGKTITSVITSSFCPDVPGGFTYTFSDSAITMTGSDGWTDECELTGVNTVKVTPAEIVEVYKGDFAFNCRDYPICKADEFKREIFGVDVDGRGFHSYSRFNRANSTLTYTKIANESDGDHAETPASFSEVLVIQ